MFETFERQSLRLIKTPLHFDHSKITIQNPERRRPSTMGLVGNHQRQTTKQNNFKTLDSAETQIAIQFRNQMSPYLKGKIRNTLSRSCRRKIVLTKDSSAPNESELSIIHHKKLTQTLDSINSTSPLSTKHIKISSFLNREIKSPFKQQQLIASSIIKNTKQKIDRIIEQKKQKDIKYENLRESIKRKCQKVNKPDSKTFCTIIIPNNIDKPPNVENLNWDQEWKEEIKKESNRYRNRLIYKHKKDMSMKIPLPYTSTFIQA